MALRLDPLGPSHASSARLRYETYKQGISLSLGRRTYSLQLMLMLLCSSCCELAGYPELLKWA